MICISVTPESRQLAKVDLLNASRVGDIVELCLDRLKKAPDMGELLADVGKPIIVSCRRRQDGGDWDGSEDERIALLRQAIICNPAYVELDLDAAKQIPRFGATKRVIAFTSLSSLPDDVNGMFDDAWNAKADIVKFTWPTKTFEQTWPLLKAVADKRELPVVGLGIGRSGITYSLLGRKFNSPWIYAALEKGMEAFSGQTTVFDLREIYDLDALGPKTRFLGLAGFSNNQTALAKVLNRAFAQADLSFRCLPMQVASLDALKRRLEQLKIPGLIVNPAAPLDAAQLADRGDAAVTEAGAADLLYHKEDQWHGFNLLGRAAVKTLEAAAQAKGRELKTQQALVVGATPLARAVLHGLKKFGGVLSVTAPDDDAALRTAQRLDVRHIPYASLYDTRADVVVIADESIHAGHRKQDLNPALFRSEMIVADLTAIPLDTTFLSEARDRLARVIDSQDVGYAYLSSLFKAISGRELDRALFDAALA